MKRAIVLVAALSVALGGCNWIKNLGKKDNVEPPTPLTELVPTAQVKQLWRAGIGKGAGNSGAPLSPTVADGRVYVASVDGSIEVFDASSGRSLWRKHLGERQGSFFSRGENSLRWSGGPAVQGDLLVVGGLDGQVYAFSAQDGSQRWTAQVTSEVIARPAIADGVVVVRVHDGRLYGLDANDGSRKWIFEQPVPALSLRGNAVPLISEGLVIDGFDNGKVVAVQLADGNMVWSQTLSQGEGRTEVERLADVDGALVLDAGQVFAAGYRGQLAAMDASSGRPYWQRELSSYAGVAVSSTTVVVVDADGNVWAFDRHSGANLWKQDQLKFRWLGEPAIQGNYAVVGDMEGYVHWLSLDDGKLAARERLGKKPIEGAPSVDGDTAYVEDVNGNIGAYRVNQ